MMIMHQIKAFSHNSSCSKLVLMVQIWWCHMASNHWWLFQLAATASLSSSVGFVLCSPTTWMWQVWLSCGQQQKQCQDSVQKERMHLIEHGCNCDHVLVAWETLEHICQLCWSCFVQHDMFGHNNIMCIMCTKHHRIKDQQSLLHFQLLAPVWSMCSVKTFWEREVLLFWPNNISGNARAIATAIDLLRWCLQRPTQPTQRFTSTNVCQQSVVHLTCFYHANFIEPCWTMCTCLTAKRRQCPSAQKFLPARKLQEHTVQSDKPLLQNHSRLENV